MSDGVRGEAPTPPRDARARRSATSTDVEVAMAAVRAGAEVVRRDYGAEHERTMKTATDFATQTDLDAEEAILEVLARARPLDAVRGEEQGDVGSAVAVRRWLVDPLCGTLNFAATTPLVAVNVALTVAGTVTAAAVADPIAGEFFWTDGECALIARDDRTWRAVPSATSGLVEVNGDGPTDRPFVGGQLAADPRLRAAFGPRILSSTIAVPWVAVGRRAAYVSDGSFRDNLHFAAGVAVCEQAGCVISDLAGDPLHTGRGLVISADAATHEAVLAIVAPHLAQVLRAPPPVAQHGVEVAGGTNRGFDAVPEGSTPR